MRRAHRPPEADRDSRVHQLKINQYVRNFVGNAVQAFDAAMIEIVLERAESGQKRRRGDTARPDHRPAVRVQTRRASHMRNHAVVIVLHIVFARPGHLGRCSHGFGNFHRFADEIGLESASESSAKKRRVDEDRACVEARDLRGGGLGTGLGLRGRIDVAAIRADIGGAIHAAPSWRAPEKEPRSSLQILWRRPRVPRRRRLLCAPPGRGARQRRQVVC